MGNAGRYSRSLNQFTTACMKLVDNGMPYMAVILCHELFRFTYRQEPYADFVHGDPVPFMNRQIERLLALAQAYSKTVTPYSFHLNNFDTEAWQDRSLETRTSNLYTVFWRDFDLNTLTKESSALLKNRLPTETIAKCIVGKKVLDMGCGSGRYSIALARLGARRVIAVDLQDKSYAMAKKWCRKNRVPVDFMTGNVHRLPFKDESFDFVFCNGVLQATTSIERGVRQLKRVLRPSGQGFIYLVGEGGICWNTRRELRKVFKKIPLAYMRRVLQILGTPPNRFIFGDTWYSPLETQISTKALEKMFEDNGLSHLKTVSKNSFDLDRAVADGIKGAREMWGDGEHRYIVAKSGAWLPRS